MVSNAKEKNRQHMSMCENMCQIETHTQRHKQVVPRTESCWVGKAEA